MEVNESQRVREGGRAEGREGGRKKLRECKGE